MQNDFDLRLNFIPITFNNETFTGYSLPYENDEHLRDLRKQYRETHVFRREGDTIQCAPLTETAETLGEETTFDITKDFVFAEYIVREALIRFFQKKHAQFASIYLPTTIILEKENLLEGILDDEDTTQFLAMYPKYEIESRLIVPHHKNVTFGIQVNFSAGHFIEASVNELIQKGVDVLNRYVQVSREDTFDPRIDQKYNRTLAGKIVGIEGTMLKLADYREHGELDARLSFLEPNTSNFRHCLDSLLSQNISHIQQKRMAQIFKVSGAKNQYNRLEKLNKWFVDSQSISCTPTLSFTVNSGVYHPKSGNEAGEYRQLPFPAYVLRPGGTITEKGLVDQLIDKYGPFDTESFPRKRLTIAVVFPERFKGNVEVFMRQFKDGVPSRGKRRIPYTQGFIRKYRLTGCEFDFFPVSSANENSKGFKEACLTALSSQKNYDLAVIVIREDFHQLYEEQNPYLVAKSTFMSHGIPVQAVEIETIDDERGRPWTLNNIALAVYAKLGGIPWVLSSTSGMAHELIFGIGSSRIQTDRLGESERFVGITTVFNGDGNYLLYNLTKEVRYEEYQDALLASLKSCMEEVKARYAWQPNDKVRLIFHQSFKKFKNIEAQTVKAFVNSITDFDVEYAFVHVSEYHPWKVFDKLSKGVDYWENSRKFIKGEFVPQRGFCIPLGPYAVLLTLTGPRQLKTPLQGCPAPLLMSVHNESTFSSQEYLVNQIYNLTFMSWKGFHPSTLPVTIAYSNWIADFLGKLQAISGWNPDTLVTKLRESRWFL